MKKNTVNDFEIGDEVFHSSRAQLKMAVISINVDRNEVTCRWIDDDNKVTKETFFAAELKKYVDRSSSISIVTSRRSSNRY